MIGSAAFLAPLTSTAPPSGPLGSRTSLSMLRHCGLWNAEWGLKDQFEIRNSQSEIRNQLDSMSRPRGRPARSSITRTVFAHEVP